MCQMLTMRRIRVNVFQDLTLSSIVNYFPNRSSSNFLTTAGLALPRVAFMT